MTQAPDSTRNALAALFVALSLLVSPPRALAQVCEDFGLSPCTPLLRSAGVLDTGTSAVRDIVSGDFDSDGHVDFAVPDAFRARVLVYFGRGDGTFEAPRFLQTGTWPAYLATGDLDGDGVLDLCASNSSSQTVSLLFGDGARDFPRRIDLPLDQEPRALAVSDLDGDGAADLVVTAGDGRALVYFGPVHAGAAPSVRIQVPGLPLEAAAADLNGNGRPDIVILGGDASPNALLMLTDFTRAGPSETVVLELPAGVWAYGFAVADLNGDQRPDIAVASGRDNRCLVYLAAQSGGLEPPQSYPVGKWPLSVAAADENRDGAADLVVACNISSGVTCLLGLGDGRFVRQGDYCTSMGTFSLATADWNEDGWPDIATANLNSKSVDVLLNARYPMGTPFGVSGTIRPPIGSPGGEHRSLLCLELVRGIDPGSVDIGSVRIEEKMIPSLQRVGSGSREQALEPQLLLRFDPRDLGALDPEKGPLAVTGCMLDGRLFAGAVQTMPHAREPGGRLARADPNLAPRAVGSGIQFRFPGEIPSRWTVRVFDVHGELIWSHSEEIARGGVITWDQTSHAGRRVPSGVYFYRAESHVGVTAGKLPVLQ